MVNPAEIQKYEAILVIPQMVPLQLGVVQFCNEDTPDGPEWNSGRFEASVKGEAGWPVICEWLERAMSQGEGAPPAERYKQDGILVVSEALELADRLATPFYLLFGVWVYKVALPGSEAGETDLLSGFAYDGIEPVTSTRLRFAG